MKLYKKISLVFFFILLWASFIGLGFVNGFLLKPITSKNTPEAFIEAAKEKISNQFVGNLAMVLVEDGQKSEDFYFSIDQPVDENSVFQVASVSKWVTSFGVHRLVELGKIDLDKPIDDYLTRWNLPNSEFDNKKVTVRRLLSHSAGLVDDLGYNGFGPEDEMQTLEESLTEAADGYYEGAAAMVGAEPGSKYMYSGAGYTILQLLIEEVSGQSFQDFMTQEIFVPLGMDHSTFVLSDKPNLQLAQLFKDDGSLAQPIKFTALAAASLYTCTADLAKFLEANVSNNPVLTQKTIAEMSQPEAFINGIGVYGMGPHLYSQNDKASLIIGHDGSGAYLNTAARIDLKSKDGIIIIERGGANLASAFADEWIFWKAEIADFVVMQRNIPYLIKLFAIGAFVILGLSFFIFRKSTSN